MNHVRLSLAMAEALIVVPTSARADEILIRQDTVIPVVFEDGLSLKQNRVGDRFSVRVEEDRDLPQGSRLIGRVVNIRPSRSGEAGYMDLEFTDVVLPSGVRTAFRAVPVPMSGNYVNRGADGRWRVKDNVKKREQTVVGSVLGGLVLGSLLKKPFEGAIVGAIAGIVLAETDRAKSGSSDTVVKRGDRLGALLERDVYVEIDDRGDYRRRSDPWRDRIDRYEPRRADRRDDGRDEDPIREDDRRDDEWRYDESAPRTPEPTTRPTDRERIPVSFDGRALEFNDSDQPYRVGSTVMVPLERTATQLKLNVERGRDDKVFYIEDDENSLRLELDSSTYRLNGKSGTLPRTVVEKDGVVYVPVEIFANLKREKIVVNGNDIKPLT